MNVAESSRLDLISVILVEPETGGNVGAVCRAMRNCGFSKLILVNPQCAIDYETYGFAMHGRNILDAAQILMTSEPSVLATLHDLLQGFDLVIGTSAKGSSYKHILRTPVFLEDLDVTPLAGEAKTALVFGRESQGLTNEELQLCDLLVRISLDADYPTMNLSHAVTVILYSLRQRLLGTVRGAYTLASPAIRAQISSMAREALQGAVAEEGRRADLAQAFENLVGRAYLTDKEAKLLLGLFSKLALMAKHVRWD
jgi:TrmH family RNA methyltransferase